jgi:tRNA pseudouridine38-40 synthase
MFNTFDCTIFEAYWSETTVIWFYLGQSFFAQYGMGYWEHCKLIQKITLEDFSAIIKSEIKGFSVPAHGLYLTKIEYDYL